jgi:hypothetical protein
MVTDVDKKKYVPIYAEGNGDVQKLLQFAVRNVPVGDIVHVAFTHANRGAGEGDGMGDGDGEGDGMGDGDGEGDGMGDGDGEGDGMGDGDGEGEGMGDGVGDGEGDGLTHDLLQSDVLNEPLVMRMQSPFGLHPYFSVTGCGWPQYAPIPYPPLIPPKPALKATTFSQPCGAKNLSLMSWMHLCVTYKRM